jgi:feruloyl esterase
MRLFAAALLLVMARWLVVPDAVLAAESDLRRGCEALAAVASPDYRVDAVEWVAASRIAAGPPNSTVEVPTHCLFRGVIEPRASMIEGTTLGTGIELRMPLDWNGRLLVQGGGGLNGVLSPALGSVPGARSALLRGYAVVSTDSGHRSGNAIDSRFAADQQARLDFAYQAVPRVTREAKSMVGRYYGRKPDRSYFMGCSTGGREAMLAAQRLPLEFDGVISGDPAFSFTRMVVNQIWAWQQVARIAPRDAQGKPRYHETFSDAQLRSLSDAVLRECDAHDGLADGIIGDHKACRFDPASQACGARGAPAAPLCLSRPQVGALHAIFGGARTSRGEAIYGSFPYDTGISSPAWRGMYLGSEGGQPGNALLGGMTLRNYVLTPPDPAFDPLSMDFDGVLPKIAEAGAITDALATQHASFAGRGGKLILYHGLSDQGMSSDALIRWYESVIPRGPKGPQDWARLYLVPGMTHCAGGQSTDEFDMLTALENWVEKGQAPDRVVAAGKAFPGRTRPLCPWPQVARYHGGDPEDARSFSCRE